MSSKGKRLIRLRLLLLIMLAIQLPAPLSAAAAVASAFPGSPGEADVRTEPSDQTNHYILPAYEWKLGDARVGPSLASTHLPL